MKTNTQNPTDVSSDGTMLLLPNPVSVTLHRPQLPFLEEHVVLTVGSAHSHDDWEATEVTCPQKWDLWMASWVHECLCVIFLLLLLMNLGFVYF